MRLIHRFRGNRPTLCPWLQHEWLCKRKINRSRNEVSESLVVHKPFPAMLIDEQSNAETFSMKRLLSQLIMGCWILGQSTVHTYSCFERASQVKVWGITQEPANHPSIGYLPLESATHVYTAPRPVCTKYHTYSNARVSSQTRSHGTSSLTQVQQWKNDESWNLQQLVFGTNKLDLFDISFLHDCPILIGFAAFSFGCAHIGICWESRSYALVNARCMIAHQGKPIVKPDCC